MLATALTVIAIVAQDQSALRASARESAPQQAVLWQGDSLEIRGENGDFLQVYDHRRERAGYVLASQVRIQPLTPEAAPALRSVFRFLKDAPGSEALGIAYAAAFLRAAPAELIDAEVFAAINAMSERLARRATAGRGGKAGEVLSAHLEVAAHYGVSMHSVESEGRVLLCPNADAARRAMALPGTEIDKALAALTLTRHDCIAPSIAPVERYALDNWRADVLGRLDLSKLPSVLQNRVRLRIAGVWASLSYQRARRPELGAEATREAAQRAVDALLAIDPKALMESDAASYAEAAARVGASRWGSQVAGNPGPRGRLPGIDVGVGQPGETCVRVVDPVSPAKAPASRCTWGVVWPASLAVSPQGDAMTLAVQPLAGWREMWVMRKLGNDWQIDVIPPGTEAGGAGYIEFAGWVPGGQQLLAAREVQVGGRWRTSFETVNMATLATDKTADKPSSLSPFYRWQSPMWKAGTVSLR